MSARRWFSLSDCEPSETGRSSFCGNCLTGFAPGTCWAGGFIGRDGDAAPGAPKPDSGDIVVPECVTNAGATSSGTVSNVVTSRCMP